jgi:BON domain
VISKIQALCAHARPLGVAVKPDGEIREDVIRELQWDPRVADPDAVGVAVKDGAVTLTGHAASYAEKLAAANSAARVYGVKAVADDVEVHLAGEPGDDADIARVIAHVLESNTQIPAGRVHARCKVAGSSWKVGSATTTSGGRSSEWSGTFAASSASPTPSR